ncbi:MAG: cell division protein FtsA [bacterium]|nr:cell division protein FtsA [bacterium]MDZ4299352.1 cell division protein FtsA [Candidatus Sungbacteria bacterium]
MAARTIIAALDVGTSTVQTVVAERARGEQELHILGVGIVPSQGIRRGAVVDLEEATAAIRASAEAASRAAGVPVTSVWLSVGGSQVSVSSSRGVIAVSRADGEISPEDVRRAIAAAETFVPRNPNKETLHIIPRDFKVDHESGVKDPVGMHGVRLEVDTLIIECSSPFLKNLIKCVEGAGLRVEDYVFGPLAAAEVALTKRQKELGVMLVDIGGGTASFIIFDEGMPVHAGVLPVGGMHITNDVAIGFRTHVDVAEAMKCTHGSCLPTLFTKKDNIRLAEFIPDESAVYSRRELAEMIEARLHDIFELLRKELKKIDRRHLLPAGVILTGGSSVLPGVVQATREEFGLPVEAGQLHMGDNLDERLTPSLAAACGVLAWANQHTTTSFSLFEEHSLRVRKSKVVRWLKSLLP